MTVRTRPGAPEGNDWPAAPARYRLAAQRQRGRGPHPAGNRRFRPGRFQENLGQLPAIDHGGITPNAARDAVGLFAEHVQDARDHPGRYPNIDRLFRVIEEDLYFSVKTVPKGKDEG